MSLPTPHLSLAGEDAASVPSRRGRVGRGRGAGHRAVGTVAAERPGPRAHSVRPRRGPRRDHRRPPRPGSVIAISVDGLNPTALTQLGPSRLPNFHAAGPRRRQHAQRAHRAGADRDAAQPHRDAHRPSRRGAQTATGVDFDTDPGDLTVGSNAGHPIASVFDVAHDGGSVHRALRQQDQVRAVRAQLGDLDRPGPHREGQRPAGHPADRRTWRAGRPTSPSSTSPHQTTRDTRPVHGPGVPPRRRAGGRPAGPDPPRGVGQLRPAREHHPHRHRRPRRPRHQRPLPHHEVDDYRIPFIVTGPLRAPVRTSTRSTPTTGTRATAGRRTTGRSRCATPTSPTWPPDCSVSARSPAASSGRTDQLDVSRR